ncbi:conserved oligomeric Golgi complex subunit 4-like, partial [Saccoglossus kowalevskii]
MVVKMASATSAWEDVDNLTDLDDIQKALDRLALDEGVITEELDDLLENQSSLDGKMSTLYRMA